MREGKPSTTAAAVAYARAIGTDVSAPDPIAPRLLPPALGHVARATGALGGLGRAMRWAQRAASVGLIDHVNLRTAAIDASLRRAVVAGIDQVVILGAGLDARAWRLPWLSGCDVFELDHPATQRAKRDRIGRLTPTARRVEFSAINFESDALEECLERSGYAPERATVWIWEGVTPYLEPSAIEATLASVGELTATGSILLMSYAALPLTPRPLGRLSGLVMAAFSALGEPLRGVMAPEAAQQRLRRHGFEAIEDTDHTAWIAGRTIEPAFAYPFRAERLVEAKRVASLA